MWAGYALNLFPVNRYCASLGCGVSDQIQSWTLHRGNLMEDCGPGAWGGLVPHFCV